MKPSLRPTPSPVQFCPFPSGGFVLHRVNVGASRYSAWFDAKGALVDAQSMPNGRGVKAQGPVWQELARVGARYASRVSSVVS